MTRGRPKKEVYVPREESMVFAEEALINYNDFREQCRAFEKMHETLFRRIDTEKLNELIDTGVGGKVPKGMTPIMENYLEKKEKILLVADALTQMPDDISNILWLRYVERKTQEEVVKETGLSDSTVRRKRIEGIRVIAEHTDVYMWCKAIKTLGIE